MEVHSIHYLTNVIYTPPSTTMSVVTMLEAVVTMLEVVVSG